MKKGLIPLHQLAIGEKAWVKEIILAGIIRRRILDLGLVENTLVMALQRSPAGDPTAYYIRGAVIALRKEVAALILVEGAA